MPKGKAEKNSKQRAVEAAQQLLTTFVARVSKKLGEVPASAASKDLRSILKSFSVGASKQLKELQKETAKLGVGKKSALKPTVKVAAKRKS